MESGVEHPHSAIYIGNSFFYYNNSLHNHVTRLHPRRRSQVPLPLDLGDDLRLGLRLARRRLLFPAQCGRALLVQHQERDRVQQDRAAVRSRDHDGLQPVPGASAAQGGVLRADEAARRHRAQTRHQAGVLHVVGLCRRAGDDGATGRGLHHRRQRQRRLRHSGGPRVRQVDRAAAGSSISMSPTSGIRAWPAPISPPPPPTARCSGNPRSD